MLWLGNTRKTQNLYPLESTGSFITVDWEKKLLYGSDCQTWNLVCVYIYIYAIYIFSEYCPVTGIYSDNINMVP